jgi:hypothetical protein
LNTTGSGEKLARKQVPSPKTVVAGCHAWLAKTPSTSPVLMTSTSMMVAPAFAQLPYRFSSDLPSTSVEYSSSSLRPCRFAGAHCASECRKATPLPRRVAARKFSSISAGTSVFGPFLRVP